jgi:Helix-turn-helix domain
MQELALMDLRTPPDARRCVPVLVRDVPLEQRVDAVREFANDFLESADERLTLFAIALDPGELVAWVAPPRPTFTNGNGKPRAKLTRDEVEQIHDLHEEGLSYSMIAERLQRNPRTVRAIGSEGREATLRRYDAAEERELARLIRDVLRERLAGWLPFPRAARKPRPQRPRQVRPPRTHCRRGHPFDEANTIIQANGTRTCRTCRNASQLAYYHQRRAAANGHSPMTSTTSAIETPPAT